MEVPMELGVQLGLGDGARQKWVQYPNPAGTIGPTSRTLYQTHAPNVRFLKQIYSRQLAVSCILIGRRYTDTPGLYSLLGR